MNDLHPSVAASFIPLAAGQHLTPEQIEALFPHREVVLREMFQAVRKAG